MDMEPKNQFPMKKNTKIVEKINKLGCLYERRYYFFLIVMYITDVEIILN